MDKAIATVFGLGNLRPASGTWASAVAILVGVAIHWAGSFPLLLIATLIATGAGFWSVRKLFPSLGDNHDPSEVVIDEVAGQWIALCFPSCGFWLMGLDSSNFPYPGWLAAFIFFRLFDIWKPWIVGRADRRGDADGIMLDDIFAGLMAGVATMIAAGAAHGFLM